MAGFIKLHRKLKDWEYYGSPNHLVVFIHLLLGANFKENTFKGHKVHVGELPCGRDSLSRKCGLNSGQIRRVINDLIAAKCITKRKAGKFSIISITNWADYQHQEPNLKPKSDRNNDQIVTTIPATLEEERRKKKEKRKNTKEKTLDKSPLEHLTSLDEVKVWLRTGTIPIQEEILKTYSDAAIAEVILEAYSWTVEKGKDRKAGTFLRTWAKNNNAQKRISFNSPLKGIDLDNIKGGL